MGTGMVPGPRLPVSRQRVTHTACCREARTGPPPLHMIQGVPHCACWGHALCQAPRAYFLGSPTRWGPRWSQGRGPGCTGHLCAPFSIPRGRPVYAAPTDALYPASSQAQLGEPQSPARVLRHLDAARACK